MKSCIMIPARMDSSRFPGKPLHTINGRPLIEWVWRAAMNVGVPVFVCSPDRRILAEASDFGARIIYAPDGINGTERCACALDAIGGGFDIVVNWQGDAPLIPPGWASALIESLKVWREESSAATVIVKGVPRPGAVCVDISQHADGVLTFWREGSPEKEEWIHQGIYAYRADSLREYAKLPPTSAEIACSLEQLRWPHSWNLVTFTDPEGGPPEVNHKEDLAAVARALRSQHEDSQL